MKKTMLFLILLFSASTYASVYQLDVKINEDNKLVEEYRFFAEEKNPAVTSNITNIPFVADAQDEIGIRGRFLNEDYDYKNLEVGSSMGIIVTPLEIKDNVMLDFKLNLTKLAQMKRIQQGGQILDLPETRSFNVELNVPYDLSNQTCQTISKLSSKEGETVIHVCIQEVEHS